MTFKASTIISKSTGHEVLWNTTDFLTAGEIKLTGCSVQVSEQ